MILAYGQVENRHFFILNIGGRHPTAYVEVLLGDKTDFDGLDNIDVHGGITFGPDSLSYVKERCQEVDEKVKAALDYTYIGWDYAHYGDYTPGLLDNSVYMSWSVDEIFHEVVRVADQLNNQS